MQNDDENNNRGLPTPPPRGHTLNTDRSAAANIIRDNIERIYAGDDAPHAQAEKEIIAQNQATAEQSPPHIQETTDHNIPQDEAEIHAHVAQQWKHYHTSWQNYYQQYYERYYLNHVSNLQATSTAESTPKKEVIGSATTASNEQDVAVEELRHKLLGTVKERAETVRKSRHFAPIATAVAFALIFLFLQYNRFIFATVEAYVSPGSIDPQSIIIDPDSSTKVGPEPKLSIPKINVDAPVIYGANPADNNDVENKLRDGVVHYPITSASSVPGQNGATVILGHSSNDVFDNGKYKFVFVQLSKLETGDTFYINYQGTRYTYSVTKKEIIDPTEISKVTADPNKPSVILITCEPPGTALKRLLVFADQVSPDPAKASKPSGQSKPPQAASSIGGQGTTFWQNIFGN